ncbi:MAG: HAD-IA family hydrolase [Planctomycetes bacterium]|nr:HAD-IA family hydrolase [Planctomycetota bacterium]
MRKLETVFLDVDDTLYSTTEFSTLARQNAVKSMIRAGLKMDEEACLIELDEVINEFSSNYEHHFDKLLLRLPRETLGGVSPLILVAAGMVGYHDTKFHHLSPYEDALEVMRILRDRGLKLGVISAGIAIKQAEKVVRLGLHEIIQTDAIFITDAIGISKSNPKLFLRACATLKSMPERCMYIGDNPATDVDIPHQIGMIAVHSRRSGRHLDEESTHPPDHIIHNFWDLLELIEKEYEIVKR